jgi:hypothetical protein
VLLGHSVLLVFGAPYQLRLLAGQEHGRTIPLSGIGSIIKHDLPEATPCPARVSPAPETHSSKR